jgi:hypothetical protein
MGIERFGGVRALVCVEAARVMYEEGVKQYFTAKRIAAKRVLGRRGAKEARFRPSELPSNGEIRDALLAIAALSEGPGREKALFVMRVCALSAMDAMEEFEPRLIGSVSTGHVRRGSDVDVQLFTDDPDGPELRAKALGWPMETERVTIRKGGVFREFVHLHVSLRFDVEFTVYPRRDLRERPRSSTDGKPIVRRTAAALRAMLASDHADLWNTYQSVGILPEINWDDPDEDADEPPPGPFDGLLSAALDDSDEEFPEDFLPSEEERAMLDDGEPYDPLPGFENV